MSHTNVSSLLQTLLKINLSWNQITVQGAQYLSDALKTNTVSQ